MISPSRKNARLCTWGGRLMIASTLLIPIAPCVLTVVDLRLGPEFNAIHLAVFGLTMIVMGALLIDRADSMERRLARPDTCSQCGYDLRGTPRTVDARCPE